MAWMPKLLAPWLSSYYQTYIYNTYSTWTRNIYQQGYPVPENTDVKIQVVWEENP
jgi:hypothetical protein